MTDLERRALASRVLTADDVVEIERKLTDFIGLSGPPTLLMSLINSHERLRLELEGKQIMDRLDQQRNSKGGQS